MATTPTHGNKRDSSEEEIPLFQWNPHSTRAGIVRKGRLVREGGLVILLLSIYIYMLLSIHIHVIEYVHIIILLSIYTFHLCSIYMFLLLSSQSIVFIVMI